MANRLHYADKVIDLPETANVSELAESISNASKPAAAG
jgi:hypothetical protein